MSEDYSLKEIIERNHAEMLEKLGAIETQTRKTNGRVTSLERWKWGLCGAFGLLAGLVTFGKTIGEFIRSL